MMMVSTFRPLASAGQSNTKKQEGNDWLKIMQDGFKNPPDSVKPFCYWYWISGNISREGITRDLEAMHRVGIGEAFIGNIGQGKPYGDVSVLTKKWWDLTIFAIKEAKRIGVDIGIFNSPGWSQSGGPWIKADKAMRYVVHSETLVSGNQTINKKLSELPAGARDIAVIAFKKPQDDSKILTGNEVALITKPLLKNAAALTDGDTTVPVFFDGSTFQLDLRAKSSFTARSLILYPAATPFMARVTLLARENNAFKKIRSFICDRSNSAVNVGPMVFGPACISFKEVTADQFRIIIDSITYSNSKQAKAGLTEITLSAAPRIEQFVEKQLGKMFQRPLPLWNQYQWPQQDTTGNSSLFIQEKEVVDLTALYNNGTLVNWKAPEGQWVIQRLGVMPTGTTNSPAPPEATGYEVDKMSKKYVEEHFNAYIGKILAATSPGDRTAFKHVVADSYEMGSENYTEGFMNDFKKRYGYDPLKWYPVLTGRIVNSEDESNRFLWDLRRLVADKVVYDYVGGLREISMKHGLRLWLENYGHWGFPSEFLMYGGQSNDIGGEFWSQGELGTVECRAASSAAHIYGKNRVYAESYTDGEHTFSMYPARLKRRGDWSFTEGVNHVLFHVYIHQPYEERNPGMNAWFGTEINRKNTWFEDSRVWIDYLRRNMFLLQQGTPVADVAYFIGEDAPKMTGIRNPELPRGYAFDYVNAEVILKYMQVKNGRLVLPGGASYGLLVLPPLTTMRPELAAKIKKLVADGGAILGPRPVQSPSLQDFPNADERLKKIAGELWLGVDGIKKKQRDFNKGKVFYGTDIQTACDALHIPPDVSLQPDEPLLWTHRKTERADIYFITNQSDSAVSCRPLFRVEGKVPQLWDATDGSYKSLPQYEVKDGQTAVPLLLAPGQSYFIVFTAGMHTKAGDNFPIPVNKQTLSGPWAVAFDEGRRTFRFDSLTDWSKHTNEYIRYWSGKAIYTNTFYLNQLPQQQHIKLKIDSVGVIALVKVNGKEVGGLWTMPYELDITAALQTGANKIEIEVSNLWVNRLIGDSRLPADKRNTWLVYNPYKPTDPLAPSGLMGTAVLLFFNQ
ncbi:MAG: glycoside hydrolase family 2 [Niabella sp.]|nr:glycoside hydrolase family 2 [Niabella sp.]